MPMEQVEYEFPDEKAPKKDGEHEILIEDSSAEEIFPEKKEEKEEKKKAEAETEIEIIDDTPPEDRGRKPSEPPDEVTDEELAQYSKSVQNRIKRFTKGYHDERREKEAAMREKQELENYVRSVMAENERLKGNVGQSRATLLEHAKRTVASDLERAKKDYKDAYEAGNSDELLNAQDALNKATLAADKLARVKLPALQEQSSEVQQGQEVQQPMLSQSAPQVDPRVQQWAEKNTWFGTDDEMTGFALVYHNKLVNSGIDPTSEEYYEKVDSRMREVFPMNFEDTSQENPEPSKPANVVAAATNTVAPKKVKLTKTQVSIAKRLGVPLELYAKQVAEEMRKNNG